MMLSAVGNMTARKKKRLIIGVSSLVLLLGLAASQLPAIGAALILHPPRRHVIMDTPRMCEDVKLQGEGVTLHGWRCKAVGDRRGTLIYLHGFADNRVGGVGVMERFRKRGFDVLAYDSRAHGESGGDACTYGFHEKEDLRRVIDTLDSGPVVLLGSSLGAAVALQLAADDSRISAVVAAESFSDVRTVVTERAPFFFSSGAVSRAILCAEKEGKFEIDAASPALAAQTIKAPVMLIHGEIDKDTPPKHSRRIFAKLSGVKRLTLTPGAGHNQSLKGDVWEDIEQWIDANLHEQPES
jgi:pimeloyl-ACP methyl ester carboxylesterase